MKKMNTLGIALIIIIGTLLRLVMIDKPEGLWNDEYVSYMIAARPMFDGFIEGIKSQCHMPFYYIYLKITMLLFGQSDLVLRLSSVFTGILSIIVMYFAGLEKDKRTGIYCAVFTSVSSFLIYYSQEVRLYSLLFLFSALTLLFSFRFIKKNDLKNLIFFIISNFLILITHTIGFVFVFLNLVYVSYKLFNTHKNIIIKMWAATAVLMLLITPQLLGILFRQTFSQWWGSFSFSAIGFLITDYFSPVITNFTGAPPNFFYNFKSGFIIFALTPALIAMTFFIRAMFEKQNRELFYLISAFIFVLVIAAQSGKLVFVSKYSMEIYPVLIYLVCAGVSDTSNRILRNAGIMIFCILNLFFLTFSPLAANRLPRKEGHKIAADLINNANLKQGDIIIIQYYDKDRFEKYSDFSPYKVISVNKGNFPEYLKADLTYQEAYQDGKTLLHDIFSIQDNEYLKTKLKNEISLNPNQSVLVLFLKSVSFYNEQTIQKIAKNNTYYNKIPLLFLVFSYMKNETIKELSKDYAITGIKEKGEWAIIRFTNLNKQS